jgi:hypothetical protein
VKFRPAALRQRVKTDVHAPAQFRAETVRNLDARYKTFNIPSIAKLYLKPNQRVHPLFLDGRGLGEGDGYEVPRLRGLFPAR